MKSPQGWNGNGYLKVNKALYGLKQSGKVWYDKLDSELTSLNFDKSSCDHCVYIHSKYQLVIGVYVDDLVICGKRLDDVKRIKNKLSSTFPVKDLGEIENIIGWKILRKRSTRTVNISQSSYLLDKINSLGLSDAKTFSSPLDGYNGIIPQTEGEPLVDETAYASAVGSLGYASNGTRPDISFATSQLGAYNSSPVQRHWNSARRVFSLP